MSEDPTDLNNIKELIVHPQMKNIFESAAKLEDLEKQAKGSTISMNSFKYL